MMNELEIKFREALDAAVAGFALDPLTEEQANQLTRHYLLMSRWNQRVNLTRIIEPREAAKLHYAESLFGVRFISGARTILDIGSGAGFPAMPIAVLKPELHVTALEANQKKSLFLKEAGHELRLPNFEVVTARLEEFDWSSYDSLTSRALDRADSMLPAVIERLTATQRLILFCGPELVEKLKRDARVNYFEVHSIPMSDERLVAIFHSLETGR
jgi:16S rRNA (guanine527-N7)-methyltransferase